MYRDEEFKARKASCRNRRETSFKGDHLIAELQREQEQPFPDGFRFVSVDHKEVDDQSSLFLTSSSSDTEDEKEHDHIQRINDEIELEE